MGLTDEERQIIVQTMREKGDYNCAYQTSEDEIEPLIEPARILVDKIVKYILK